jgi:hypothetical protein
MLSLPILLLCIGTEIPVSTAADDQLTPVVCFANSQYYVFWEDRRSLSIDTLYGVYCARMTPDGTVLDPDGRMVFKRQVRYDVSAAADGINFLVAFEDSC